MLFILFYECFCHMTHTSVICGCRRRRRRRRSVIVHGAVDVPSETVVDTFMSRMVIGQDPNEAALARREKAGHNLVA